MTIYTTAFAGTNLPANGCANAGCHGAGAPAVASAGHQLASNNPTRISDAIAANTGGMGPAGQNLILTATQLRSLALYIGQIKVPAFTVPNGDAGLALAVRSGAAATKDIYPLIVSNGSGGAARDGPTGVSVTTSPTNGGASATQVGATSTMNYNVTYTSNAGYFGPDSVGVTVANDTGSVARTIAVTVLGISSAATVTGLAGQTYTAGAPLYQITSNDGAASNFTATNLPAGLSVDAATGRITGTVAQPTVPPVTVTVGATINSAVNNGAVTKNITLTIVGITSAASVAGTQGQAIAPYQITTNGTPSGPYSAPGLPPNLSIDTVTGLITGVPTASGTTNVTVSVVTTAGTASQTVAFNIASAGTPVITSPTVVPPPGITVGQAFNVQMVATNPPITSYSATGLPPGLNPPDVNGLISGTPTQSGTFTATLGATNVSGPGVGLPVVFTVNPNAVPALTAPVSITTTQNQVFAGTSITATNPPITAYGGTGLPNGLSVNPANGQITGTATVAGTFNATLTATNVVGTGSRAVPITVIASAVPGITSPTAVSGVVGQALTVTPIVATNPPVTAYGGTGLPPGLSVDPATGNISGTPTQTGTFSATLTATNNAGTGSRVVPFTISVAPIPPVAGAAAITVQLNTPANVDLAPFITNAAATGIVIASAPAHGTATVSGTRVIYTPVNNYFGADTFTYAAINQFGTSPPGTVTVTVVGRPDPTKDASVTGLIAAQADAALRFSRTQISNFQRRMESLHRRSEPEPGAAKSLNAGADRAAPAGPAAAAANVAAAVKQMAENTPAFPGQDPLRVANASAPPPLPDSQSGGSAFSKLFPLVNNAASMLTSRSVNLGSLAANATGTDGAARNPGGVNFWVEGNASFGTRDPTAGRSGLDFSTSGISFGADRQFGDQWSAGIGAGFARDRTDIGTDGTQSRAHGLSAALYGSYQPGRNVFVDGLIGVGKLDFETQRFVAPVADYARSDRDGYQVFGSLAAGYEHRDKGLLVSPYARLDYSADRLDQATEAGAGQFALTYFKQNTSSVQGALGLRAESVHATHFGWAAPRIRVEYRHEFQDERLVQLAYADLIGGPRFAVSTGPISRNALALGIGSDFVWRDGLTIGIDYQLLHSSENASHAFRLRISKELDGPGPGSALRGSAAPSGPPLDIRVDAGWLYDDNVTRSREPSETLGDQSYSLNVGKVIVVPLTDHVRALVGGSVGAEKFRNYDGLSKVTAGFSGDLQYRPSAEFGAPTFALFGRATAEQYESERRDGYRNSIGISMRQSLTDRIDVFGALAHNERYADSAVFTTRDNSARLNLDWGVGPRSTLYMGAEYRRGDIVSSGRPSLENLDIAEVFVADDAYPGKGFFAYRFEGRTVITTLGYNLGLGPRDSLDFSWRRGEATPSLRPSFATSPSSYIANQFSIVYLTRF